jgi:hypothetical protein
MMEIPVWQYKVLVESNTKLHIIEKICKKLPPYQWEIVLNLLLDEEEE